MSPCLQQEAGGTGSDVASSAAELLLDATTAMLADAEVDWAASPCSPPGEEEGGEGQQEEEAEEGEEAARATAWSLPLHGMLELADGSYQVVDDRHTYKALVNVLQVRDKHARRALSARLGITTSEVTVPPGYILPNTYMTEAVRELRNQYMPLIKQSWENRHQRTFTLRTRRDTTGCNIHSACPLCQQLRSSC